jgi:predicted dehydrogenase
MLWQMRVDPQNMKIKEVMDSGILGQILMFRRKHCLSTHTWPAFQDTWHVKKELNRGMWFDDASHPFDLVRWMFGKPRSVMAEIDTLVNPRVPDDNGIAVFRAESGAIVEVFSSFTANAGETTTEIHGDKGSLIQLYGDGVSCGTPRAGEVPALRWLLNGETAWTDSGIPAPSGGHGIRIADLSRPLVDFFLGNRAPIATVYEGRDVVEMLLASYESARIGKRILFPFS